MPHAQASGFPSPSFALEKTVSCSLQVYRKRPPLTVARGTGPRHRSRYRKTVSYSFQVYRKRPPLTVARGPVPRHRSR